ncbi:hypothetical protein M514_04710 [Trichuris suis]|uniref:cyclin-dependent kinase n=1 Tax=Trichuris suis TaxID=68888 RepID=A0A085N8L0_9BILA|nr:hypothetical protein M514_04710 [Trichuris suis]
MGGGRMRRIRERLSQALKPNSSPSAMVCSESQNFGRSRNCLSSHDAMRLRCSRSACCVMNDSISELAERLEENGIIDEEVAYALLKYPPVGCCEKLFKILMEALRWPSQKAILALRRIKVYNLRDAALRTVHQSSWKTAILGSARWEACRFKICTTSSRLCACVYAYYSFVELSAPRRVSPSLASICFRYWSVNRKRIQRILSCIRSAELIDYSQRRRQSHVMATLGRVPKSATFHDLANGKDDKIATRYEPPKCFGEWLSRFCRHYRRAPMSTGMVPSFSLPVVHEDGSDGKSPDASPSYEGNDAASPSVSNAPTSSTVKMRKKKAGRRWTERDIQKRLSLPADLRLPLSVVEKLNTTPILNRPLTRKSRRASLSEIGFGKLESYQKLEKLGEGTYATVYKGRSRLTDALVALKEIRLEQEEGAPCTAIREVSLLRELRHANVVTLHDIIYTDKTLTLVFEYLDSDLKQYMDACGNLLSMNNIKIFAFQILRGLAYCHARRVLHRDLKPQNLLINQRGELKLADFGLARAKSVPTKTYSNEVVTLWYRPPDILLGCTDYSTHIDMWGVGCILYEMVTGRPFFPGRTVDEQLHLIFRALGTPRRPQHAELVDKIEQSAFHFPNYRPEPFINHAPRLDMDGLDLLSQLLQFEGRNRIGARMGMRHAFFSSLPAEIHDLDDSESIFVVPGVHLSRDPGRRNYQQDYQYSLMRSRRQSML